MFRMCRTVSSLTFTAFTLFYLCANIILTAHGQDIPPVTGERKIDDKKGGDAGPLRVAFDDKASGVVFVYSGNRKYRIDTSEKTFREIPSESEGSDVVPGSDVKVPESESEPQPKETEDQDQDIDEYYFEPGFEPYDYRLINVPTTKSVPKGSINISFSHRFSQPVSPISESARGLFGFDSFSVSSFGVSYGVTDRFYVSASRNPICRKGLCRTIEIGAGYHWLDQGESSPIGLTTYASVEGNDNFTRQYNLNFQMMVSRSIGKRLHFFFSPAVHLYTNGGRRFDPKPEDFFPPSSAAETFRLPKHAVSFGFGSAVSITPSVLGLFEFTPRVGFKLGRVRPVFNEQFEIVDFENFSEPSIGFGVQKNIGRHSFALTFSNTQTTTTSKYNSSNLVFPPRRLVIGFNLFRRF